VAGGAVTRKPLWWLLAVWLEHERRLACGNGGSALAWRRFRKAEAQALQVGKWSTMAVVIWRRVGTMGGGGYHGVVGYYVRQAAGIDRVVSLARRCNRYRYTLGWNITLPAYGGPTW